MSDFTGGVAMNGIETENETGTGIGGEDHMKSNGPDLDPGTREGGSNIKDCPISVALFPFSIVRSLFISNKDVILSCCSLFPFLETLKSPQNSSL